MKNFIQIVLGILIIILITVIGLLDVSAQIKQKDVLTIKGKVLWKKKADITVFEKEANNNWVKMKTMYSRARYAIKLSPIKHYYIVFVSKDGIQKELFVEGGNVVNWVMNLDVDFNEWTVKFTELHQSNNHKNYKLKITHKENLPIKIVNEIENSLVSE
jgi:hypothetical protein